MSYDLTPFAAPPGATRNRAVALVGTVAVHVVMALILIFSPEARKNTSQWVEMVVEKPKPPPPPPEPEKPKPEPEKPKPKPVDFKDIPKTPPPTETPPPAAQPRRVAMVQGLAANSFSTSGNTGLSVNAGTGLNVADGKDKMSLDDAKAPRSYASVTRAPKAKARPNLDVPAEAKKAGIEGEVKVQLVVGSDGRVKRVDVIKGLGYGIDEACKAAWLRATFTPGDQNGQPVEVTGYPEKCTVIATE